MSDSGLNVAPTPELLAAAANWRREGAGTPGDGRTAGKPFADLLSGVLQGTQPPATGTEPALSSALPAPAIEPVPEAGAATLTLLALPGSAVPLPAAVAATASAGIPPGKTLPAAGNPLPEALATATRPAAREAGGRPEPARHGAPAPAPAQAPAPAATAPGPVEPRFSLADLALSRPLEPASTAAVDGDQASTDALALLAAGRSLTDRRTQTTEHAVGGQDLRREFLAAGYPRPRLTAQGLAPGLESVPTSAGADVFTAAPPADDFLRGMVMSRTGAEITGGLPGQNIAAFAAGSGSGPAPADGAPQTGASGTEGGSAALRNFPGSTTLPALQPLGPAHNFAGGLADRLLTLGGPGTHSARLKLHPEHLGALDVEIQMDDGTAQVWFGTTTVQARDAIEGSLPRLRELFADQGVVLTRAQVDAGNSQAGQPGSDQQYRMAGEPDLRWAGNVRPAPVADRLARAAGPARLLDVFA